MTRAQKPPPHPLSPRPTKSMLAPAPARTRWQAASRLLAYAPAPLAFNMHLRERVGGEDVDPDIPTTRGRPLSGGAGHLGQ